MENNKIKKEINDVVNDNLKALERLFPSAVKDGQLDIKALKEELGDFEEVGIERYELNWAGKQKAKKMAQQGIGNKTLKFVEKDSKNADTTENIYIEGDNLEVLKLLRQNYYNSIKMIYIDPPYNTGNDFVYNDIFKKSNDESDKEEGYVTETGERLEKNTKSNNSRFHTNWLNMMYPRLKLARNLLTDDGVIFISIDDNEQANLKRLCDEIFGEENFVGIITRVTKKGGNKGDFIKPKTDFIIMYFKSISNLDKNNYGNFFKKDISNVEWLIDENNKKFIKGEIPYRAKLDSRPNQRYYIECPDKSLIIPKGNVFPHELKDGALVCPESNNDKCWTWSLERYKIEKEKNRFYFYKTSNSPFLDPYGNPSEWSIVKKIFEDELKVNDREILTTLIENCENSIGTRELENLGIIFSFPKSVKLLHKLLRISTNSRDIILDFFSGSATTAHAVMKLNSEDNGNRKYIMVQLPETTDEKSEAFKAGYKNIAEIGKERIRRAGEKIKQEIEEYNSNLKLGEEPKKVPDIGFKVFKVDNTNIKWYDLENFNEESQYSFDDPDSLDFVLGSNDIDIVYEIMLRQNDIPLSERLEVLTDIGNRTYFYASTYLICLETEITEEMVEKLASLDPLPIKFVFRDSAFNDNISLKDETFRKLRSLIERNSGESKVSYRVEFI